MAKPAKIKKPTAEERRNAAVLAVMDHPVTKVIWPIRADAIARAEKEERAYMERELAALAEMGWDRQAYAPYPSHTLGYNSFEYRRAERRNRLMAWITEVPKGAPYRRQDEPEIVVRREKGIEKFVNEAKDSAAAHYDSFTLKLIEKVGPVVAAELSGNHVWSYSILTVTHPDGTQSRWKTQQIINRSVLDKLFNQWPTRKLVG